MKKHNTLAIVIEVTFIGLLIAMIVQMFPIIIDLFTDKGDETSIAEAVGALGWRGIPALIGLSALQVIIPFIPIAAVGVLAGLSYGVIWGPIIFLVGIVVGNIFVMFSMRQLSGLFKPKAKHGSILSKESIERIKRPEILIFFMFLLPFPSGVIPYLFSQTKISMTKYLLAVVAGSIPASIIYAVLGDHISKGNYTTVIVIVAVLVVVLLIFLPFKNKIMSKLMNQ
jgi:uncharacterized membrane protein YdjX (TVP38/TMEM64 family)